MNPNDINVLMLESVAQRLGDDLLGELVFVGGAVAGLLITRGECSCKGSCGFTGCNACWFTRLPGLPKRDGAAHSQAWREFG